MSWKNNYEDRRISDGRDQFDLRSLFGIVYAYARQVTYPYDCQANVADGELVLIFDLLGDGVRAVKHCDFHLIGHSPTLWLQVKLTHYRRSRHGGLPSLLVDMTLPGDDDPRRQAVRQFLSAHPQPTGRQLAEAGYVAPHWPAPWGLGADPVHQLLIDDELRRARVRRPDNAIGIGWAGPTIIHAGTDEQKERYLLPLLAGEEIWCQLFSEPGAGSDLANLSTRAVRDGETYVVSGQKVWTSGAHLSKLGILIARTDPDAPKHRGITYLICPMDSPGITIRPIVEMTGAHNFNEVFFDEVHIPVANRVGDENDGWALAKVTLGNERVSLSGEGSIWGRGPTATDLIDLVRRNGGSADPVTRQRLAVLFVESEVLRLIRLRTVAAAVAGKPPGPEASVRKALADDHGKHVLGLAKDLCGAAGMLSDATPYDDTDPTWPFGFLFSPALTIGGGTAEVQRNIIAERVLGLPHEPDLESGKTWAATRQRPSGATTL